MTKVELYTSRGCGACVNAKRMFDSKKVPYEEIRLGSSRRVDTEYQIRTNGSKTVPQIFINGEWIGGFEELLKFEKPENWIGALDYVNDQTGLFFVDSFEKLWVEFTEKLFRFSR